MFKEIVKEVLRNGVMKARDELGEAELVEYLTGLLNEIKGESEVKAIITKDDEINSMSFYDGDDDFESNSSEMSDEEDWKLLDDAQRYRDLR